MKYAKEAGVIWKTHVPKNGPSLTVEGELIRYIEKLRWEAQENGNVNWDDDFIKMCKYLKEKLCDDKVFTSCEIISIENSIDRLMIDTNAYLESIVDGDEIDPNKLPYVEDFIYDDLIDFVVLWAQHYGGSVPRVIDPNLKR